MSLFDLPLECWLCSKEHHMEECSLYVQPTIMHKDLSGHQVASGFCPQQSEGHTKDGRYFYFRNRHGIASLTLSKEPMQKEEFWSAQFVELHSDGCPETGRGNGVYPCLGAVRMCRLVFNEQSFSHVEIDEETDPEVAYGGWPYDQRGQDERNSVFAKLWDMANQ